MSKNKPYYFACSYPLEKGSIILPGNWGRIITMYNTNSFGNAWIQYREDVFEKVRSEQFSDKPSRLESIFLCESKEDLDNFVNSNKRTLDILYEVELVDKDNPVHRGCLSHLNIDDKENYLTFEEKAEKYWEAANLQCVEILTTSRIRVLNKM